MPQPMDGPKAIEQALGLLGELLRRRGERFGIVLVGGAAMNLLGVVTRATTDADIIALRVGTEPSPRQPDEPLPASLRRAAADTARELRLAPDWLDARMGRQWITGLPPGMMDRVQWRAYGALDVGLADRVDLISLKLHAAADDVGPRSVHFQDLRALRPTAAELADAAAWVREQDPSDAFAASLAAVLAQLGAA